MYTLVHSSGLMYPLSFVLIDIFIGHRSLLVDQNLNPHVHSNPTIIGTNTLLYRALDPLSLHHVSHLKGLVHVQVLTLQTRELLSIYLS